MAKKNHEFTAVLYGASSATGSGPGPVWDIHTSEGTYRTGANEGIGYDVRNHADTRDPVKNWRQKVVVFTATPGDRIRRWCLSTECAAGDQCRHGGDVIKPGEQVWVWSGRDDGGPMVPYHRECVTGMHYVARDGTQVSPLFETSNGAFVWLMHHQAESVLWAMTHEGYSLATVVNADGIKYAAGRLDY